MTRMSEVSRFAKLGLASALTLLIAMGALLTLSVPALAAGTVTVGIQGKGDVTGTGIDCDESSNSDCTQFYPDEEYCEWDPEIRQNICFRTPPSVDLVAESDRNGYAFSDFDGCDSTSGRSCTLTVTEARTVTARFSDVQAPLVSSLSPGSGIRRGTIPISVTASDNSGTVSRVAFSLGGVVVSDTTAPFGVNFDTTQIADGSRTLSATAYDPSGRSAAVFSTITIDNTKPVVNISGGAADGATFGPNSTQTWTFSASDATSGVQSVRCSVVPVAELENSENPEASFGPCSGGSTSHSVTNRPEGTYRFAVRAQDFAGNEPDTQSRTFTIDATPPETTIDEVEGTPAQGSVVDTGSATFAFSSEDGALFECALDRGSTAGTFEDCESAKTYLDLEDGEYTFRVRAVDGVGNVDETPAARTWTIARAPTVLMDTIRPLAGEKNVLRATNVEATFSEIMKGDSLTTKTVKLQRYDGKKRKWRSVPTMLTLTDGGTRVVLDPFGVTEAAGTEKPLPATTKFRVAISTKVQDAGGTPLARSVAWTFKTGGG